MRALVLLAVAASAAAQPASLDPDEVLSRLGTPWEEVAQALPPPDRSTIADGTGRAVWLDPGGQMAQVEAHVHGGRFVSVVLTPTAGEWADFKTTAREFERVMGPPGFDGFFPWIRIQQQMGDAGTGTDVAPFDMGFFTTKGYAVMRAARASNAPSG